MLPLKNVFWGRVSILVLMESMYKNFQFLLFYYNCHKVSILVLMDLCIKTKAGIMGEYLERSFNPCFNGSMYKNQSIGIALMLG